jgi:hypothetical protein
LKEGFNLEFCAGIDMTILRNANIHDRTKIAFAFEPFAKPANIHGMVIGNDLDSIISACFLKSLFGWNIVATYDYKTLWYSSDEKDFLARLTQGEYVAIDLDIYHPQIFSLGHHILENDSSDVLAGHARTLNPNFIRGINVTNFKRKYPLGTIHFLIWLFNQTDLNRPAKFLMWLADSAFINAQSHRFRENVLEWVKDYFQSEYLLTMSERVDLFGFEESLEREIFPALKMNPLVSDSGQVKSRHLNLGGYQCQWSDPNCQRESIVDLFQIISSLTGWTAPKIPGQFLKAEGKRQTIAVEEIAKRFGTLDKFLSDEKVFSYVFPFRDSVNYTCGII